MRLKKIQARFHRLHPKKIDLSLNRIKKLTKKLGNPQDKLKIVSIIGTNGKYSTAQALKSILENANYKCDLYTSPHIKKINERFIFSSKEVTDIELSDLLEEVEKINNKNPITFFEICTAAFFLGASRSKSDITIVESGLFHRFDACSVIKKNIASVITPIGLDHLDWLPKNNRNIDRIIFEKTSRLLNSKIIIAEQSNKKIADKIEKSIKNNHSKKIFFKRDFNYTLGKNNFFYYKDKNDILKLPYPKILGEFQISNISTAIAALRNLDIIKVNKKNIKFGIKKIKSIARIQEIKKGKLKKLSNNNTLIIDGSHNPLGASVLKKYLDSLNNNKNIFMILGMMKNKDHIKFISYFKNTVKCIFPVNIPEEKNSIKKIQLKKIIDRVGIKSKITKNITAAIKEINSKNKKSIILITGSLYLAGKVINLN